MNRLSFRRLLGQVACGAFIPESVAEDSGSLELRLEREKGILRLYAKSKILKGDPFV